MWPKTKPTRWQTPRGRAAVQVDLAGLAPPPALCPFFLQLRARWDEGSLGYLILAVLEVAVIVWSILHAWKYVPP